MKQDSDQLRTRALSLVKQGRLAEAGTLYAEICEIDENDSDAQMMLGIIDERLGNMVAAISRLRKAVALRPDWPDAYCNLGEALRVNGDLAEAETCLRRALELRPEYALAHARLGQVMHSLYKRLKAMASYQRALELDPNQSTIWFNLGVVFQDLDRVKEAETCYRRAVAIDPAYAKAIANLGYVLYTQDRLDEARESYIQALQIEPDNALIQHMLAAIGEARAPARASKEYVKQIFDESAHSFDNDLLEKLEYRTPEELLRAVNKVTGKAKAELEVLDLGCGTGLCGPLFRNLAKNLVGVDLSPKMIDKARERNVYDELLVDDIVTMSRSSAAGYDLIIAADVFVYIGDLEPVFASCEAGLRPDGLFAFSVEAAEEQETYVLRDTGRYAHSANYVRTLAKTAGLRECSIDERTLRKQGNEPVAGYLFVLQKPDKT